MVEDKLTKDERIRLEAVNQANLRGNPNQMIEHLILDAKVIEGYIRNGGEGKS